MDGDAEVTIVDGGLEHKEEPDGGEEPSKLENGDDTDEYDDEEPFGNFDAYPANPDAPEFVLPQLVDNPMGWGPTEDSNPEQFKNLPFAPFKKSDSLAKASDWNAKPNYRGRGGNRYQQESFGHGVSDLKFDTPDEGKTFSFVDTQTKMPTTKKHRKKNWNNRPRTNRVEKAKKWGTNQQPRRQRNKRNNYRRRWYNNQEPEKARDPSIKIKDDWDLIGKYSFDELQKKKVDKSIYSKPEDLRTCGALPLYRRRMYDRLSARKPPPLTRADNIHYITTTTSDDPILQELMGSKKGNVFFTDSIMALLMTCTRSIYGWDIVVTKRGETLCFDQRIKSRIDFVTVNETGYEPKDQEADSINHPANLSQEATFINHNFSHQVVSHSSKDQLEFKDKNPFLNSLEEGQKAAAVGYRYRTWELSSNAVVVARCELNGYLKKKNGDNVFLSIKALNEFDRKLSGGIDWRQRIENQWGSVLLTEIRNNNFRLARWAAQAILAGAHEVKLGCVSRKHPQDSYNHDILAVQKVPPTSFAQELSLNQSNMWGILNFLVEECLNQPDGKYLLFKNPNQRELNLFRVPEDAFDVQDGEGQSR